ncbi:ABC-2 type transport system ATP-binding protein [Parelusimicrobium proximum]|uniref:ABC transporter ATP-binding protein n=1 Tax=Parelusimicrobium proximum TaxID=3228953 RepID=UPI003D1831B0
MDKQNNDYIITVKDLVVAFGGFKAVDNISFEVKRGEIFGFLGANGAGKTTTIRTICGILLPTSGEIFVDGKDVSKNTAALKPMIGYMSQKFTLYQDLTVRENIEFAGALYDMGKEEIAKRAKELFDFISFKKEDEDTVVKSLSGGVKQIVSLCATLLNDPKLIFLDEPTAGVSPQVRVMFWDLIRKLAEQGKTVFVTTHYMDEAEYCNRIVLMQHGKIIALGNPGELKKKYYPDGMYELKFTNNKQAATKEDINKTDFAKAENVGLMLKVEVKDKEKWEKYIAEHKNDFHAEKIEAALEDVFLKAVSG